MIKDYWAHQMKSVKTEYEEFWLQENIICPGCGTRGLWTRDKTIATQHYTFVRIVLTHLALVCMALLVLFIGKTKRYLSNVKKQKAVNM